MAYSDYGAFVLKNGERRTDKEDVALFATDEETFGESSENIGSAMRIWVYLMHSREMGREDTWLTHIHHGIMGDGQIRVMCHKQGLPQIFEMDDDGNINEIVYYDDIDDGYEYDPIYFEYKGYKFVFKSGKPYEATMTEPDGTKWLCKYDYMYGAGFQRGEVSE